MRVTEAQLRVAGFGFRAPFVVKAVSKMVSLGGDSWLDSLRSLSREQARTTLQQLAGVGPKVADCICLCSLQMHDAIPVDTHCWYAELSIYFTFFISYYIYTVLYYAARKVFYIIYFVVYSVACRCTTPSRPPHCSLV
jgi:hypothetical protein